MPEILFLTRNGATPSTRVRVLNLVPELENSGLVCTVIPYPKNLYERLKLFLQMKHFDLVILQKKLPAYLDNLLLRSSARKLVYDFDDAVYFRHSSDKITKSRSRLKKFTRLVQKADLVVSGNRILADFADQFSDNVEVVPSAVETRNIPIKVFRKEENRVIIGWIGSDHTLAHLKTACPALSSLAGLYDLEMRIISNVPVDIPGVRTKFIPWKLETQACEVSLFDIGIMPLPDNDYTRGKCGYKALQYMAAGVPPVVSDVGVNSTIVNHGLDGLVAGSEKEFHNSLETLIKDGSLRRELGGNARLKVEKEYSIQVVGKLLSNILLDIV